MNSLGERLSAFELKYAHHALRQMQRRDRDMLLLHKAHAEAGLKDLSFGRLALSYPEDHFNILKLIYPDLVSVDAEIKKRFTEKFLTMPASFPYRINPKEQGNKQHRI